MENTNEITMKILRAGITLLGTKLEKRKQFIDENVVYDFKLNEVVYTFYPKMKIIIGGDCIKTDISNKQQFVRFINQHI